MSNETSGITHLNPEMLLPMDIDLPSSKNSCFKGRVDSEKKCEIPEGEMKSPGNSPKILKWYVWVHFTNRSLFGTNPIQRSFTGETTLMDDNHWEYIICIHCWFNYCWCNAFCLGRRYCCHDCIFNAGTGFHRKMPIRYYRTSIRPCSLIRTISSRKDLIHRTGDYTLLLRNGMNPLQAFLAGTFSSGESP